jgi:hypothetical protein
MAKQTAAAGGLMPIITPSEVATPFPPLNCAKTGKTWPKQQKKLLSAVKSKTHLYIRQTNKLQKNKANNLRLFL